MTAPGGDRDFAKSRAKRAERWLVVSARISRGYARRKEIPEKLRRFRMLRGGWGWLGMVRDLMRRAANSVNFGQIPG